MEQTGTIWKKIFQMGHISIIPAEFGQNQVSSLDVFWSKY